MPSRGDSQEFACAKGRRTLAPDFGCYLAGLTDGEGCFYIGRVKTRQRWVNYTCTFTIKLRSDDLPLLEMLHQRVGVGRIGHATVGRHNPASFWTVSDKKGCLYLAEVFDEYPLRSKKRRDYAIWREAVIFWASCAGRGTDWSVLERYCHALRTGREYKEAAA